MIALANALRQHTVLRKFIWIDLCSWLDTAQITALDPVLRVLQACTHIWDVTIMSTYVSCDAMKSLLQLQATTRLHLVLETTQWLAVTDEIRRARCNVHKLDLATHRGTILDATEAVKAVASAIPWDRNLEHPSLQMENGFTDEAGVALAEALTANKTLHQVILVDGVADQPLARKPTLGVLAYEAFSAMLRVNGSFVLDLSALETTDADARLLECRNQLHIEQ